MSKLFGGKDPFDDPFFSEPFGGFFGEKNPFADPFFASPFGYPPASRKQISIEEINPDDDDDGANISNAGKELSVRNPNYHANGSGSSFSYRRVAYGDQDGMYYTCSEGRMNGGDGVFLAEMKEEDKIVGESLHTISKGIHDKGHSVTKKNSSDGRADSLQTLHNLHEGELKGFEENWKNNADKHLPGWSSGFNKLENSGANLIGWDGFPTWSGWGGWAPPSIEYFGDAGAAEPDGEGRRKKVVRVNVE
ncbi:uncharacterized protein [Coffea arabica]|uniref:Uncharacterized protein LOC113731811 n=1 Tax=Coffea arabica TaxID=13443 RepID=A0A6P6WDA9_COFAR|nr:uncharacterized protein LOC113731811 [Coffea arabica]XP_027113061.1 uncharacterized protein LOC113731811 [Coffea arabica]